MTKEKILDVAGLATFLLGLTVIKRLNVSMASFLFLVGYWWLFTVRLFMRTIDLLESKILCGANKLEHKCGFSRGAIIGVLERTLLLMILVTHWYLAGLRSLENIGIIILGILGIKSLYRFNAEKEKEDWIIIGTLLSIILGTLASIGAILALGVIYADSS